MKVFHVYVAQVQVCPSPLKYSHDPACDDVAYDPVKIFADCSPAGGAPLSSVLFLGAEGVEGAEGVGLGRAGQVEVESLVQNPVTEWRGKMEVTRYRQGRTGSHPSLSHPPRYPE